MSSYESQYLIILEFNIQQLSRAFFLMNLTSSSKERENQYVRIFNRRIKVREKKLN
jgi:hypothetical protein